MTLSLRQLQELTGLTVYAIRWHIRQGNLTAKFIPGAKGLRVEIKEARRWARQFLGIEISTNPNTTIK